MKKIRVLSLPDYGRRIPVNGEIKNTDFEEMVRDVVKGYTAVTKEPSKLPEAFLQADIERVEPPHTQE